jgi:hypothetical protein
MFKKLAITVPLAVIALSSQVAVAAGEASHTVNLRANIPTTVFHAQPRDPNWGRDETMNYNVVSGELAPLTAIYDIRNTTQNIPLTTTLNGVTLTGTPQEVVNEADSTPGVGAEMRIVAAKPTATQRGAYTAVMPVVFDAVLPAP